MATSIPVTKIFYRQLLQIEILRAVCRFIFTKADFAADFTGLAEKLPVLRRTLTDKYFKIADNSIALIVAEIRKKPDEIAAFD
jgi:hypothetical protein